MKKISIILASSLLLGTGYLIAQDEIPVTVDEIPMEAAIDPIPQDAPVDPAPAPEVVSTESMGAVGTDSDAPAPADAVAMIERVANQTETTDAIPPTLVACGTLPNNTTAEVGVFPAAGDFKFINPYYAGHEVILRISPDNSIEMFAEWKNHAQWGSNVFYAAARECTAINHGEATDGQADNGFKCAKASRHLKFAPGDTTSPQDRQKFVYDAKNDVIIHYKGGQVGGSYSERYEYKRVSTNTSTDATTLISSSVDLENSDAFAAAVRAAEAQEGKKVEPLSPGPSATGYYR